MSAILTDLVTVTDLHKNFGARKILQGIDLQIPEEQITVILGRNGAGKTTLLRILDLLETADTGTVSYDGIVQEPLAITYPLRQHPLRERRYLPLRQQMLLSFQYPAVFSGPVLANVTYGLRLRGAGVLEAEQKAHAALQAAGIDERAHQHASSLSGGEAARLAMARALALRPRLLLLDEPSASLDPSGTKLLEDLLLRMKSDYGMTVVMVTQDIFEARRIADRVAFLHEGRIIEEAPRDIFFGQPHDDRTRRFIAGELLI